MALTNTDIELIRLRAALTALERKTTDTPQQSVDSIPWANVTGKPAFATVATSGAYGDLTGVPPSFTPSAHSHAIADVTGLQTALDGKQAAGSYAAAAHSHIVSDVTGLQTALDGKAATSHGHAIADVTGLQTALDGKSATSHTHSNATTSVAGFMSASDKTKLDGVASGAQVNVPTDLAYTAATRLLASSTGADATLPLVSSTDAGLAPASGGGISNFLRADGSWVAPPIGSPMRPAVGLFISPAANGGAIGTVAQAADRNTIAPFVFANDTTIDQVAISVSTLVSPSNAKVVVYNSTGTGRPNALLAESAGIDCSTTGTKTTALSVTFLAGIVYWIGVRASSTQTLRSFTAATMPVLSYTTAATPVAQCTLVKTETYANPAASPWGYSSAHHSNLTVPLVLMRVA